MSVAVLTCRSVFIFLYLLMANMSYCRFQNTLDDLRDCYNHFGDPDLTPDGAYDDADNVLSRDESVARAELLELCRSIVDDYDTEYEVVPVDDSDDSDDF